MIYVLNKIFVGFVVFLLVGIDEIGRIFGFARFNSSDERLLMKCLL
jgi:hypothetical protein